MTALRVLWFRVGGLFRRSRVEAELESELAFHLEMESKRHEQSGMPPEEARREALRGFGGVTQTKESYRATGGLPWLETVLQDLRYAARSLRKQPGFTAVAVLTLAVGIGANTAIYTVLDATMLRSLPYKDPSRLMRVSLTANPKTTALSSNVFNDLSWPYPKYEAFLKNQHVFAETALYEFDSFTVRGEGAPEILQAEDVSASYFPLLGVRAELGRTFLPEEDTQSGQGLAAVISHDLWLRRYGAERSVIGKTIADGERTFTIVGVLPAGFQGLTGPADVWFSLSAISAEAMRAAMLYNLDLVARLRPGVTVEQAKTEVAAIGPRVALFGGVPPGWEHPSAVARTLEEVRLDPLIRKSVLVLFGAVVFVLLIACANIANLLLARGAARQREIAIRFAIGAGRVRVARQLLTESVLLAVLGGLASLLFAYAGVSAVNAMDLARNNFAIGRRLPGLTLLGLGSIHLDGRTLLFTFGIAVLTGILFGLAPVWQGIRAELNEFLQSGSRSVIGAPLRGRSVLVVAEVALAVILLAGAGLMMKSFSRLFATRTGVDPANVLTARLRVPLGPDPAVASFYDQLEKRVASLPGVISAGLSNCHVLAGGCSGTGIQFFDRPALPPGSPFPHVGIYWVSSAYFKTMKIPLLRGRWFTDRDAGDAPKVALIGETAARMFWPGQDPIGKQIGLGMGGPAFRRNVQVVGVVGDVRYFSIEQQFQPDVYIPHLQAANGSLILSVRAERNPAGLADAVRREAQRLNPNVPVYDIKTLEARIGDSTVRTRFIVVVLALFAGIAVALAAIGIYGVISYMVRQRTQEIGIRMALGARAEDVRGMIVKRAALLAGTGLAIGVAGAFFATRALGALLYEVKPSDPATYASVSVLLAVLALLAAYVPAHRASKIDPCVALRAE